MDGKRRGEYRWNGKSIDLLVKKRYLKNENMESILREYFFIMERINYYNWKRLRIDVIMVKRIREWGEFIFTM